MRFFTLRGCSIAAREWLTAVHLRPRLPEDPAQKTSHGPATNQTWKKWPLVPALYLRPIRVSFRSLMLAGTVVAILLSLGACTGGGGKGNSPSASASFALRLAGSNLTAEAGSDLPLSVTVDRLNGQRGAITLSLVNPPQGLSLSGSIPDGANQATAHLILAAELPVRTYSGVILKGLSGTQSSELPFTLVATPGRSTASVDRVQATGGLQQNGSGSIQNSSLLGEPVNATPAQDASNQLGNRPAFTPPTPN